MKRENYRHIGEGAWKVRGTEHIYALYLHMASYFVAMNLNIPAHRMEISYCLSHRVIV